jgi:SHS2 domain-containing protein
VRGHAGIAAVRVERAAGDRAEGTVTFSSTDPPAEGTFVKAVTYHRLRVGRDADGWLAEVYLDV